MALTSRITLTGPPDEDPEDFLCSSLGVIFPDDVTNQHGDADHGLLYTSPYLPQPLHLSLARPDGDEDRRLFSHYLWNSSLLLADLVEADTLHLGARPGAQAESSSFLPESSSPPAVDFDVTGLSLIELGAGTALPSLLAALYGAERVVITDYPAPAVLGNLRANAVRNVRPALSPLGRVAPSVAVEGHRWGELAEMNTAQESARAGAEGQAGPARGPGRSMRHAFDRVLVCDCLWMPWQHANLRRSIGFFLAGGGDNDDDDDDDDGGNSAARAWIVAGFHTGRDKMRDFFGPDALAADAGLEVERIWERDCDGRERPWAWDRGVEDVSERKRWLVIAVLRRVGRVGREGHL